MVSSRVQITMMSVEKGKGNKIDCSMIDDIQFIKKVLCFGGGSG